MHDDVEVNNLDPSIRRPFFVKGSKFGLDSLQIMAVQSGAGRLCLDDLEKGRLHFGLNRGRPTSPGSSAAGCDSPAAPRGVGRTRGGRRPRRLPSGTTGGRARPNGSVARWHRYASLKELYKNPSILPSFLSARQNACPGARPRRARGASHQISPCGRDAPKKSGVFPATSGRTGRAPNADLKLQAGV